MENLINRYVSIIQVPGIRKFSNMVVDYPNAINLTLGQPDFPTPNHIKEAAILAIRRDQTSYTHNAGLLKLREVAADYVFQKYKLSYNPVDEIIVTNGATEAIDIAFRSILQEGSEVILPAPIYPGYEPLITLCGAIPVYVDTSQNSFQLTAEMIMSKLSDRTRCIVLCSPSNPTGSMLSKEEIIKIADVVRDKKIFIVSDEIYSELTYDNQHFSIASVPGMREKTIVVNGLAKSHAMTGWRIGFTFAPSYLSSEMLKVHLYNSVCASTVSQHAAIEALTNGMDDPVEMVVEYRKRRDYVCERLISMGLEIDKPDGAFYVFPSIKHTKMTSFDFSLRLLKEAGVAVVPGDSFSGGGEGYIRMSFAASIEMLEEGLNRMERFIHSNLVSQ
ncbi:aminotransferase A [Pseudoneobacillus rhizosphaerae]|uniref:Aminotransferase n=1 Tax=Pseudoneobacillus rhizosphaerae TaxID=2880968 RepID=A0A9C7LCA1_9BACI|nr:aminotransferase A [Pseudoneobacillus rhizosphaerae]CAG9609420.1 putative N-acetyl-LL-diaminopimelate aminotransferase [Pseudoneobacillus rhizosphaerae]